MTYITGDAHTDTGDHPAPPLRRRDRMRQATATEIKDRAWAQIAEAGAASLSLRAIARDMGMTSSALYRYFSGRDELLSALARDGFGSLADHLEEAEATGANPAKAGGRDHFLRVVRAYRRWALTHPGEYALAFGTPVPGFEEYGPEVKAEMFRGVAVLFRVMSGCLADGTVTPPRLIGGVRRSLRAKLGRWAEEMGLALPPEALASCLFVWTQLHGAISLELFGHMPPSLLPCDDLFEQQMHVVMAAVGWNQPTP